MIKLRWLLPLLGLLSSLFGDCVGFNWYHNYDIEGIIRSIDKMDSCYIIISIYYFYEKNFVKCKLAEKVSSESCI